MTEAHEQVKKKGQVPFLIPIISGTFLLLASIGGAWFTSNATVERKISTIDTKVELVQRTEELHYRELKEDLNEIKNNIQKLVDFNLKK